MAKAPNTIKNIFNFIGSKTPIARNVDSSKVAYMNCDMFNNAFYVFSNCSTIVVCDQNINQYKIFLHAFQHFYLHKHDIEIIHYKDLGLGDREFKNLVKQTDEEKIHYSLAPVKLARQPTSIITTSLIQSRVFESYNADTKYRGLPKEHYSTVKNSLMMMPEAYDLGNTRDIRSKDQFLTKLSILYNCKFYIGSACGWARWGMNMGIPTITTFYANRINKLIAVDKSTANKMLKHVF